MRTMFLTRSPGWYLYRAMIVMAIAFFAGLTLAAVVGVMGYRDIAIALMGMIGTAALTDMTVIGILAVIASLASKLR